MTDAVKMPTLTEVRSHVPKSYWNPSLFSAHFSGERVDPEDSKLLSFAAYRVNIKQDLLKATHTISVWFYRDDDDAITEAASNIVFLGGELNLEIRQYDRGGDLVDSTVFEFLAATGTETELDWGASDVVGFVKITFTTGPT